METYQVSLNGRQYSILEKMLCSVRASQLARNQCINGYELFSDMIDDISSPVTDGWSAYEIVQKESIDKKELFRFMTKAVFPEDEDYFVRQIGESFSWQNFQCKKDFEFQIFLNF